MATKPSKQRTLGAAAERPEQYANDAFFTICNYEQVMKDILAIEACPWDLIILDEGQRIKNWEAKTSRVIKGLRSPFALVLTGTPMENRIDELYSVVEFIDDQRLGPAYRFFNQHRVVNEDGKVTAIENLEQRIARAHRMGQKRPVQVYILVTEDTLEERLLDTLSAKKELALAALDMDSETNSVALESGMEELKRRLEILLGAEPDANADESQAAETEAALQARRTELAASGGQMLTSAFAFLENLLPASSTSKRQHSRNAVGYWRVTA